MVTDLGLCVEEALRYMDDLRLFMYGIKEGWRWMEGELCWTIEWEEEDRREGAGMLERTCKLVRESLNMVFGFLNFTIESELDFEDRRLPTLDFKLWVGEDLLIRYTFFE